MEAVAATARAFAALSAGRVTCWGDAACGGACSALRPQLRDVWRAQKRISKRI